MKYKFNEMIYRIAIHELLIDNNRIIDFGNYTLESYVEYRNYKKNESAALVIFVRLVDKTSKKTIWGNIYIKILLHNVSIYNEEDKIIREIQKLSEVSDDEKIEFILRPETEFNRKFIKGGNWCLPYSGFFNDLAIEPYNNIITPCYNINGRFPNDALLIVKEKYDDIVSKEELHDGRKM